MRNIKNKKLARKEGDKYKDKILESLIRISLETKLFLFEK